VARALENPGTEPTYLEFFGLTQPPFARLSQSCQIFHTEQYSLLMAHLATATEQPDCLVVVCGAEGSGKTTLLNRYIASLKDDVCFVTIDESCDGEKEFYSSILGQLGFGDITGTSGELWRITREFLVHRGMSGDPVLVIIDSAHLSNPTVLEQLRRISTIKVKNRRVLSVVLAGTQDLRRIMDSPAMSQVKFHSSVMFNIRVYTEEETANYVWHRLRLSGGSDAVKFSSEAHQLIYRYTGGTPKLINMLCNDLLTGAYALESNAINADLVRTVANTRRLLPHVVPLQGRGRRKTDPDFKMGQAEEQTGERITPRDSATKGSIENSTEISEAADASDKNLLDQVSQLSEQVGEFRADKLRALEDLRQRDQEIAELQKDMNEQTTEFRGLASVLDEHGDEVGRLKKALSDSTQALLESEKASNKLLVDLEQEREAAKTAQKVESEKLARLQSDHGGDLTHLQKALTASEQALLESKEVAEELSTELERKKEAASSTQAEESEKLASALEDQGKELSRLQKALTDSEQAVLESKKVSEELSAELERERQAATTAQDVEAGKLAGVLEEHSNELGRLEQALSDSEQALLEGRGALDGLSAELEKEREAATAAQAAEADNLAGLLEDHSDELGRLRQTLSDKEQELIDSNEASNELSTELEREREATTTAQAAEAEHLAGVLEDHSTDLGRLQQALSDSEHALLESNEASQELSAELEREKEAATTAQAVEAEKLAAVLEDHGNELGQLQEVLSASEQALHESENAASRAQMTESEKLASILEDHNVELERLHQARSDSEQAVLEGEKTADALTAELARERELSSIAQAEDSDNLARVLEDHSGELGRLQQQLLDRETAAEELAADLERERKAMEDLAAELDRERETARTAQMTESEKLNHALQEHYVELGQLQQALSDSEQTLLESKEASDELSAELQQEKTAAEELSAELERERKAASRAQMSESEKLTDIVAEHSGELGQLQQALSDSDQALLESKEMSDELSAEIAREKTAAEELSAELARERKAAEELSTDLEKERRSASRAQMSESEKLTDVLEEHSNELARLQQSLSDGEQALLESEKAAEDLSADLESERKAASTAQKTDSDKLAQALEDHGEELGRLQQALSDSEQALHESKGASDELSAELQQEKTAVEELSTDLERERKAASTAQVSESDKLVQVLDDHSEELGQLQQALSDSEQAFLESEKAAGQLTADLEREREAAENLLTDFSDANAKVQELSDLKSEMQVKVDELSADLKSADERNIELDTLGEDAADLKDEIEQKAGELNEVRGKLDSRDEAFADLKDEIEQKAGELNEVRGKLDSRDEAFADLEKLLEESQNENASLRPGIAAVENLEETVSEKDARIEALISELAKYSREIISLEAKNEELESHNRELDSIDDTSTDELEVLKTGQGFTGTVAQLTDGPKTSAPPKSTAGQAGAVITAFEVIRKGKIEQVIKVPEGQSRIMIGRGEDSELCLDSKFTSRHHALIFCTEQGHYIEDLNSFNGTKVNSEKITRCDLKAGDIVTIGDFQIRLRLS